MRTSETTNGQTSTVGEAAGASRTADYGIAPPGYRLPDATRLGRVRLEVADLGRSISYYEEILGLRILDRRAGEATLGPAGDANPLIELHERKGARAVPRHGRLGLYHFAILLPDRSALGRFLTHLAERSVYAGMSDHLVSEAVYLTDPDGLGIEVYADRPRSLWQHAGRQLVMATEPLDVRSVMASAGGEPWAGAPKGTVLGHVHLHVGDIDRAAAFYHTGLGFDRTVWNYPGALFLSAGGYHHHLGTNTWAARAPRAEEGDARLLDWEIVLPRGDVEAAGESLERAGYPVERSGREILARDPWGTGLRLVPAS
jgi:catechol 2,3-dioxygenase